MKIEHGNLLKEVTDGVIIHGVNAQGVMGSGFAKQVREIYPQVYTEYVRLLGKDQPLSERDRKAYLGFVQFVKPNKNLVVANAVVQHYYGKDGAVYVSYDAIKEAFLEVRKTYWKLRKMTEIHYPKIGAGLGGGDWNVISDIINECLEGMDHTLWEYQP